MSVALWGAQIGARLNTLASIASWLEEWGTRNGRAIFVQIRKLFPNCPGGSNHTHTFLNQNPSEPPAWRT